MIQALPASSTWRGDLIAAVLTILWLVIVRQALECPWEFGPVSGSDGLQLGIPFNPGDTWSYLSWINQYRDGQFTASLLYTTDPHHSLLWIFPLWLIGTLAALCHTPTLGMYWIMGLVGAAATVVLFRRAGRALGLTPAACFYATIALVLGSGATWAWHVAHRLGAVPAINGGEFAFLDFFPSSAFVVYPYHAMSYALLAGLWWAASAAEQQLVAKNNAKVPLIWTSVLGLLLTISRPYEPFAFFGAYTLKTIWIWRHRHQDTSAWRASRVVLIALAISLAPGMAWNFYVSTQPVWSDFAHGSLALGLTRIEWLTAFGGLWLLALFGALTIRQLPHGRSLLPVTSTILGMIILLGIGHAQAKLASGLVLGALFLSGVAIAALVSFLQRRFRSPTAVVIGALCVATFLGTPSLALGLLAIRLSPSATMTPELYTLVESIPLTTNGHRTIVLTDAQTGEMLPGWRGLKVYAGHFSLTNDFWTKKSELNSAGLNPDHTDIDQPNAERVLSHIITKAAPDYALIDVHCSTPLRSLQNRHWKIESQNATWALLKAPHE